MRWTVVFALAAVTLASLPRLVGSDALDGMHRFFRSVAIAVDPVVRPVAGWFDETTQALRERLVAVEDGIGQGAFERPGAAGGFRSDAVEPRAYRSDAVEPRVYRGGRARTDALSGSARVIDGDTLEVRGERVRLYSIDAPESAQSCRSGGAPWSCGHAATQALANRIGGRQVVCKGRGRDNYRRVLVECSVEGQDLGAWMVTEGWAFAYTRYSRAHTARESRARAAKRGVWRGEVTAPWDWRQGKRLEADGECNIKGNISRSGNRTYHVPGGKYYARTRINTANGERWFCSESDARAAGWRRSRR